MLNEAVKKQFLSSAEVFQAARWEGKPWWFKLKYAVANHPEISLGCLVVGVIAPLIATYRFMNFDTDKYKALDKYRMHFTIVRDDHPDIEKIKKEKEFGREFFPK